jgi:hypothetical protein
MNKCIIYIRTEDLSKWNDYMWNLRTNEPSLPPAFKTSMELLDEHREWVQMEIPLDDLVRIYDMMDEYATMVEKFNNNKNEQVK